jgi:hypothetical protein
MGLSLLGASRPRTFPFRIPNLAAFLEDLFHKVIAREGSARPPPVFGAADTCGISEQRANLPLQCCHPFF